MSVTNFLCVADLSAITFTNRYSESLDHNKPPPSLILKMELFAFLAYFFLSIRGIYTQKFSAFSVPYKKF